MLKSFSKANPKTALASDIVGSIAPVAASLLLTPLMEEQVLLELLQLEQEY